jgi:hypothetical protein
MLLLFYLNKVRILDRIIRRSATYRRRHIVHLPVNTLTPKWELQQCFFCDPSRDLGCLEISIRSSGDWNPWLAAAAADRTKARLARNEQSCSAPIPHPVNFDSSRYSFPALDASSMCLPCIVTHLREGSFRWRSQMAP